MARTSTTLAGSQGAAHDHNEEGVETEAVSSSQLLKVAASSSVGMLGFGFVDNFVMIVAGDFIDASLGTVLGLSAMAAAALGNTFSDVVGYYTGDAMEAVCEKLGIGTPPPLSEEQLASPAVRSAQRHGGCIGLTLGCLLGMCPLLWMGDRRVNISPAELMVYSETFGPEHVSPADFRMLIDAGHWKTVADGEVIVKANEAFPKVMILVDGIFENLDADGKFEHAFVARPTWIKSHDTDPEMLRGRMLKIVVGGSKLVDSISSDDPPDWGLYPHTMRAKGTAQYIIWDRAALERLCHTSHSLERAFCALVRKDAKERESRMKKSVQAGMVSTKLHIMLESVFCDEVVCASEKRLVTEYCATHGVRTAELVEALEQHGWTLSDWQRGRKVKK